MIANKVMKMNYKGEIKRSSLPGSFEELKKALIRAYSITEEDLKAMSISYMDDEGDTVIISDEFDYHQSLIYLEKENSKCLRINLEKQQEINKQNSQNFEVISQPLDNFIFSPKSNDNINSQNSQNTINELRLSGNLVKSEIICKNEGNDNDSNDDYCKDLINNLKCNPDLKLNPEEKEQMRVENVEKPESNSNLNNPYKKIEEKIVKHFDKLKNNLRKKAEKVGIVTHNFVNKILSKIKKQNEKPETEGVDSIKKKFKDHIKNLLEKKMKKLTKNLVKEVYEITNKEIDRLIGLETTTSLNSKSTKKTNNSVHPNVRCDGCNIHPIVGSRFKCSICKDFDFCEDCENKNVGHKHAFIKIRSAQLEPIKIITQIKEEQSKEELAEKIPKTNSENFYYNKLIDLDGNIKNSLQEIQKVLQGENLNLGFDIKKLFEFYGSKQKYEGNKEAKQVHSLSSKCITDNLTFETKNHTNEIRKSIKLINNGKISWPKPCYFTCIQNESNIYGPATPIRVKVNPESEITVDVGLNLKDITKSGEYTSVWQLQNHKRIFFGQKIILKIKVNYSDDITIRPNFVEIPREIFLAEKNINIKTCADLLKNSQPEISHMNLVQKMKQMYDLKGFKDNQILYAIVMSQGNIENAFNLLQSRTGRYNYHQKNYN
jgi:hypothetical protein